MKARSVCNTTSQPAVVKGVKQAGFEFKGLGDSSLSTTQQLRQLEHLLQYQFKNIDILRQACNDPKSGKIIPESRVTT